MPDIFFKKDEPKEDESKDNHTYLVYLTDGKVFHVKATDFSDVEDNTKFIDFYDRDLVVASIKAELVCVILDKAYAGEESIIVRYDAV